ncbi:PKD domain-containing protein [Patescibacteria group bacterium]|nr:PKD domain-containing protein [Patescibacteria group bacterium]
MIIGNGPVVVFPPDSKNPDIPVVTLVVDRPTAKVGEPVTLEVKSSVLTNSDDFIANRIIKYDFDGDGIDDLSTKDTKVTYVYEKDGIYTPRVKVTYRKRSGTAKGLTLNVEKGTKAQFLFATLGKKIIIRDISLGDIVAKTFCLDLKTCKENINLLIENRSYFVATYPEAGKYAIQYDVADKFGNSSRQRGVIDVTQPAPTTDAIIVTLPGALPSSGGKATVQVGKGLDNTVLFYAEYAGSGDCFIDKDIALDSNKDGTPDQDRDIACGQETMIKYIPQFDSSIARLYYSKEGRLLTTDINIQFLDFDNTLPEELKATYGQINMLIDQVPDNASFLRTLLLNLRNNLIDPVAAQSIIVQIHDVLETNPEAIGADLKEKILAIITPLTNQSGQSALGGSSYQNAKQGILYLLPGTRRLDTENLFISIESSDGDKGVIRDTLDKIMLTAQEAFDAKEIDAADLAQIQQQKCAIIEYYAIEGTTCVSETDTQTATETATSSGGLSTVLVIILWIVGIL